MATLILPADVSWGKGGKPAQLPPLPEHEIATDEQVNEAVEAIKKGKRVAMLLGGRALREPSLMSAAKIAAKHGVKLFHETFPTRLERGVGLPRSEERRVGKEEWITRVVEV